MTEAVSQESLCIAVPKTQGEKALELSRKLRISDKKLQIQKNVSSIYIPLKRQPNEEETIAFKKQLSHFYLETRTFVQKELPKKTLAETLKNQLPSNLLDALPRALDIVGDIAIVEIPLELKQYEKIIGKAIMESQPKIRTVLAKAGPVSGPYRLRKLSVIAGEPKTTTFHKEFGCKYKVDLAKAYFSPRLSQEHKRVALLVQEGETIVDMFAGIGPFSVLIAKTHQNVKVYAVDVNPDAIQLLGINVRLNRVENHAFPILGNATEIIQEKLIGVGNRVIMNLPENAVEFIKSACLAINASGGTVHFYSFVRLPETVTSLQRSFSKEVEKAGRKVEKFSAARTIRETAPYEWQTVLDARII